MAGNRWATQVGYPYDPQTTSPSHPQLRDVPDNSAQCMILANVLLVPAFFEVTLSMTNQGQPAGRRPSKLSSALQNAVTRVHTVIYRSSNGVIGGRVANSPVLLLTTKGRRSGKQRTVPLLYLIDGRNVVLVASNGGAVKHPTWWLNLQTTPEVWIQIKGIRRRVKAEQASAVEKQRLWPRLTAMYPGYKRYQEITDRDIPVVILRSVEEEKICD